MTNSAERVRRLLTPNAIAVVGASNNPTRLGGRPIANLRKFGFEGPIIGVNPKYDAVQGEPCVPSVQDITTEPDLYIFASPAPSLLADYEAACRRGMRSAVVFTSGFAEVGAEGAAQQRKLRRLAHEYDVATEGPNCIGYISATFGVTATFATGLAGIDRLQPGGVSVVSQSGGFGMNMFTEATLAGARFAHVINTGNQVDLTFEDYLEFLAEDSNTRAVVAYVEGITDGARFLEQALRLRHAGKPLAVLRSGTSERGARAALSHTAASGGSMSGYLEAARRAGVAAIASFDEMVDFCRVFDLVVPPGELSIATISGGAAVHISDGCSDAGVPMTSLAASTASRLETVLPAFGIVGNPADVTAQVITNPTMLEDVIQILMDDEGTGCVMLFLGGSGDQAETLINVLERLTKGAPKPLIVAWSGVPHEVRVRASAAGVNVFSDPLRPLRPLGAVMRAARESCGAADRVESTLALGAAAVLEQRDFQEGDDGSVMLDDARGFDLLAASGVSTPNYVAFAPTDLETVLDVWAEFPAVLKVVTPAIVHKSAAHAIATNLASAEEVRAAAAALGHSHDVRRLLLVAQVPAGLELLVGGLADESFGQRVVIGAGGVWTNTLKDTVTLIPPLDPAYVDERLRALRIWPLVQAALDEGQATVGDIVGTVQTIARLQAAAGGLLAELECNPIIVGEYGVVAVDVLGIAAGKS